MSISNITVRNLDTVQRAIVIKNNVDSFEMALAKSLMITVLEDRMKHGVVNFLYSRSNGDVVEVRGTTQSLILIDMPDNRRPNSPRKDTTLFYNLELEKWQGFKWERFVGILNS